MDKRIFVLKDEALEMQVVDHLVVAGTAEGGQGKAGKPAAAYLESDTPS